QTADGAGDGSLHHKLGHDAPLLGTQGLSNTDLPGALSDGYQHDVHDADTAHHQGNGGNGGQNGDHHVEHLRHHVQNFGHADDGKGAVGAEDLCQLVLHQLPALGGPVLIHHSDGVAGDLCAGAAGGGGIGEEDHVVRAALLQGVALLGHHAHDLIFGTADADGLSHRIAVVVFIGNVLSHHADVETLIHVDILQAPTLGDTVLLDGEIVLANSGSGGERQRLCPYLHGAPHRDSGGDQSQIFRMVGHDAVHILFIHIS